MKKHKKLIITIVLILIVFTIGWYFFLYVRFCPEYINVMPSGSPDTLSEKLIKWYVGEYCPDTIRAQ